MTTPEPPIAEEDLHGWVDDQLTPARRAVVQAYLDAHPEAARQVAAWSAQRDALRAAFALHAAAPLPPELNLSRLIEERLRARRSVWRVAASVVLALLIGGAGGWLLHTPRSPGRDAEALALLEQQGVATHRVYAADKRHPIEVAAAERDHLSTWLSNRLSRHVTPPELEAAGYRLIGGRLLATEHGGAAALFMYEDAQGARLSVVLRPMSSDLHAGRTDISAGPVNGCVWINGGLGYAVMGPLPDATLNRLADRIGGAG